MTISTVVKSIQQTMREDVGVDGDAQTHIADVLDAFSKNY